MSQLPAVAQATSRSRAAPFGCGLRRAGTDATWVHAGGELDLSTAPQLERTIRAAQLHARLVGLDTREVSFIDCSGLRVILAASAGVERGGPPLVMVPGPVVDDLLKLAGVDDRIWTLDLPPPEPDRNLHLVPGVPADGGWSTLQDLNGTGPRAAVREGAGRGLLSRR